MTSCVSTHTFTWLSKRIVLCLFSCLFGCLLSASLHLSPRHCCSSEAMWASGRRWSSGFVEACPALIPRCPGTVTKDARRGTVSLPWGTPGRRIETSSGRQSLDAMLRQEPDLRAIDANPDAKSALGQRQSEGEEPIAAAPVLTIEFGSHLRGRPWMVTRKTGPDLGISSSLISRRITDMQVQAYSTCARASGR